MKPEELKKKIIEAGNIAAAATKKLAIFDAFDILSRIENEKQIINNDQSPSQSRQGFAERRSK